MGHRLWKYEPLFRKCSSVTAIPTPTDHPLLQLQICIEVSMNGAFLNRFSFFCVIAQSNQNFLQEACFQVARMVLLTRMGKCGGNNDVSPFTPSEISDWARMKCRRGLVWTDIDVLSFVNFNYPTISIVWWMFYSVSVNVVSDFRTVTWRKGLIHNRKK